MYKKVCTYKDVFYLLNLFFLDVLVAVAQSDLEVPFNRLASQHTREPLAAAISPFISYELTITHPAHGVNDVCNIDQTTGKTSPTNFKQYWVPLRPLRIDSCENDEGDMQCQWLDVTSQ